MGVFYKATQYSIMVMYMARISKARSRRELRLILFITILVLAVGTFFYHIVENMDLIDSFYFSVITLTTVGYGDIAPRTDIGKLFTAGYVIIGIGIIATFARTVLQSALSTRFRKDK